MRCINICNIYIVFGALYLLQGTFYPLDGVLSKICLGITLLISLFYWYIANKKYKLPLPLKVLNVFVCLLLTYALIYQIKGDFLVKRESALTGISYIYRILNSLLPIYPCYVFTCRGKLNEKNIRFYFFILLIAVTGSFYVNEMTIIENKTYVVDGITNNVAYKFTALLPLIFLYRKKPIILLVAILYILLFVIMGMKRGAILITFLILIYIICNIVKTISLKKKLFLLAILMFAGIFLFGYVSKNLLSNDYFLARIEQTVEGDSSGRDDIYSFFIDYVFYDSDFFKLLLGGGTFHTIKILGIEAHNDWLEIIVCYGLLGACIYFIFWQQLYIYCKKSKAEYKGMIMSFILLHILKTIFSMGYESLGLCAMISLGYCMGRQNLKLPL